MKKNTIKSTLSLAAGIVCLSSASLSAALSVAPTEYWQFDGDYTAEVDNATNAGGLVTSGTGSGAFVTGKFGQAIGLNSDSVANAANDAWVEVPDADGTFDMSDDNGTVSMWFTLDSYGGQNWQALLTGGEGGEFRIHRNNNGAGIQVNMQGAGIYNSPALTTGNLVWHHLAFSTDSVNGTQVWFDGALTSNATVRDIAVDGGNSPFTIGNNAQDLRRGWNGQIDDLAFWDTALTDADIQQIYNGGTGASIASLVNPIPEATSMSLIGMVGLGLMLRRRRS